MIQYICDRCGLPLHEGAVFISYLAVELPQSKKEITFTIFLPEKGVHLHHHCYYDLIHETIERKNLNNK